MSTGHEVPAGPARVGGAVGYLKTRSQKDAVPLSREVWTRKIGVHYGKETAETALRCSAAASGWERRSSVENPRSKAQGKPMLWLLVGHVCARAASTGSGHACCELFLPLGDPSQHTVASTLYIEEQS